MCCFDCDRRLRSRKSVRQTTSLSCISWTKIYGTLMKKCVWFFSRYLLPLRSFFFLLCISFPKATKQNGKTKRNEVDTLSMDLRSENTMQISQPVFFFALRYLPDFQDRQIIFSPCSIKFFFCTQKRLSPRTHTPTLQNSGLYACNLMISFPFFFVCIITFYQDISELASIHCVLLCVSVCCVYVQKEKSS